MPPIGELPLACMFTLERVGIWIPFCWPPAANDLLGDRRARPIGWRQRGWGEIGPG